MTTGAAVGIGIGVVAVGAGALLILRKKPIATVPTKAAPPAVPHVVNPSTINKAKQPPLQSAIKSLQTLDAKGCALIAGSKKVPSGLAKAGCNTYEKYLSPVAGITVPLKLIEHVPLTGGPTKKIEAGVSKVANKVLGKPVAVVSKTASAAAKKATHAVSGAIHAISHLF